MAAALCLGAPAAGASGSQSGPLVVQAASLIQSGRDLVWTIALQTPFSPAALRAGRRSLCLLIERRGNGSVSGELCLMGPRPGGRSPRLAYQPVTPAGLGHATVIAASERRDGARELTATFLPAAIGSAYRSMDWQVLSTLAAPPCAGAAPGSDICATRFPGTPAVARLHLPQLVGCTAVGPAFVYDGPSDRRQIALTFDDGPWYQTPQFLALLEHYDVPATFFEVGEHISAFGSGGSVERRMLADGDMIGDHTWSHQDVAGAGVFARGQIEDAADAIRAATGGFTPCLFRAPYGDNSPALTAEARSLGFTTIEWNIDPRDWARPGTSEIYTNVVDNARPGGIVELHDGGGDRSETLAALPGIITTLRARGYSFVTVTQLLGQQLIYR